MRQSESGNSMSCLAKTCRMPGSGAASSSALETARTLRQCVGLQLCLGGSHAQAWDNYYNVYRKISKMLSQLSMLELEEVSPKLLGMGLESYTITV